MRKIALLLAWLRVVRPLRYRLVEVGGKRLDGKPCPLLMVGTGLVWFRGGDECVGRIPLVVGAYHRGVGCNLVEGVCGRRIPP